MPVQVEHHPSTLPRHHLEAEVVHLRGRLDTYNEFLRMMQHNKDVPVDFRRTAMRILSGGSL